MENRQKTVPKRGSISDILLTFIDWVVMPLYIMNQMILLTALLVSG